MNESVFNSADIKLVLVNRAFGHAPCNWIDCVSRSHDYPVVFEYLLRKRMVGKHWPLFYTSASELQAA